ncbi:phage portal protein [Alloscardovia omnicolens]|uniref:phage portal protein n=3 Tax=Bacteria TaxID=2 RepID=UPI00254D468B|nr:phage portal protein [Alloscardovia omnicolens]MDK6445732.1 phage portal protein [Alloscardovia omnicolens]
MSLIFSSMGKLNDWAAAEKITVSDPGIPLLAYNSAQNSEGLNSHPIREVTDFIARHISSLPLKVYRRKDDGSRERIRDRALAQLAMNPSGNPAITPSQFWYSIIQDGLLFDRFLMLIEHDRDSIRLVRVPTRRWNVITSQLDEPVGVKVSYGDNSEVFEIGKDNIILNVGYAHSDGKGDPKPSRLKAILSEYESSLEYRRQINKKGLRAPVIIERKEPWSSPESRERFQRGMKEFIGNGSSTGSGILLEDGMTMRTLDMFKPIDMNDLEARDKVKIDIANAYGIPAEIIGIREGNFSNLTAFKQMMYGTYLDPYIVQLEQTLNLALRPQLGEEDNIYIEFDRDAQLRGDPAAQYQALVTATGRSIFTTNEAREILNKPKVDGGDDIVTPLNVLAGGQTSPYDGQTESRGKPAQPVQGESDDNSD